jgi:glycerol-3-phosphate O-acyltransferase
LRLLRLLFEPLYWLAGKLFSVWARPTIQSEKPAELINERDAAICYVLESGGLADTLALERACKQHGLPSPTAALKFGEANENSSNVVLRRMRGIVFRHRSSKGSTRLHRLVEAAVAADGKEMLLVPVAIYWGRSPDKERSLLKLLFSEDWDIMGRTRKLFATLVHGRNTLLRFSEPLSLRSIAEPGMDPEIAYRKVSRVLRVHFRQRRAATVGPDLSHLGALLDQVVLDPAVRKIIDAEAGDNRALRERATQEARKYAREIAARISYPTIRTLERFLNWVWHKIYDGIVLSNIDRLHEVGKNNEVIYVPCHRSHIDYLLMSFILYNQGLHVPHVAAGINLNMPVIGPLLRRGGAFFLRRSFKGNRLYGAVFNAYLNQILQRGYSIEYFVEGGRSRTGRLLTPKAGLLAMTVNSYVREPKRPVVFVPIYFGYEKLLEGGSFISELSGGAKNKESLFGLFRTIKSLREDFGKVFVNIGEPIMLEPILDRNRPDWRDASTEIEERPPWLTSTIEQLGDEIMRRINCAAAVTPISLLASCLLSAPKQTMGVHELRRQLQFSQDLLARFHYADSVSLPDWSPEDIIDHGENLKIISRVSHPLGDVVTMAEKNAVQMTYFRNNIQHLFAVPASIACCFIQGRRLEHSELQRLVRLIYPFMKTELRLKWSYEEIDAVTSDAIEALVELKLLTKDGTELVRPPGGSGSVFQLLMLGQSMVPMLQRYYLVVALLVKNGKGTLSRTRLESLCQNSAQRLAMIYGLHSPDFFDKALFKDFISTLQAQDVLRRNSAGLIDFDDDIERIGEDARLVLGEEIRHSILSLTFSAPGIDRL